MAGTMALFNKSKQHSQKPLTPSPAKAGDAPDFVEVGEAGIAMDDAMRRQRRVQLVG
jgi:hypothetical protein